MTKTTVTNYETTEVEIDGYECEQCGGFVTDEDEIVTDVQAPGDWHPTDARKDITEVAQYKLRHLCNDCSGLRHAVRIDVDEHSSELSSAAIEAEFAKISAAWCVVFITLSSIAYSVFGYVEMSALAAFFAFCTGGLAWLIAGSVQTKLDDIVES